MRVRVHVHVHVHVHVCVCVFVCVRLAVRTFTAVLVRKLSFLVADTQLYKRLCPSVGLSIRCSVGPLVRWSVSPSVCHARVENAKMRSHETAVGIVCV